jgi:branched-chain amino acid transport system permease protein
MLFVNIIVVSSFRVMTITGEWSLAHIPLMGVGAYTAALLAKSFGFPFIATLFIGGIAAGAIAYLLSYPLLRMKGFAFFIGSYAAGEAIRLCWVRFRNPFGGTKGIFDIPGAGVIRFSENVVLDFRKDIPYYFLTLVIMIISLLLMLRLSKSRIGKTMKALHQNDSLAKSVGIPVLKYKALAFVIAAFFAGIAGVLLTYRLRGIDPHLFGFSTTMYLLLWVIIGGTETFIGPVIGVVLLTIIAELIRGFSAWVPLVFGVILIITIIFLPRGLESLSQRIPGLRTLFSGREESESEEVKG